jgi:hypothetical protein
MRPTIKHWQDATIRIWRANIVRDDLGTELRDYFVVNTYPAAINRSNMAVVPSDGGLASKGKVRWYGDYGIDVQQRDICEVMTGPETGNTWEVNQSPSHPQSSHTQVDCIEYHGGLPNLGDLS